MSEHSDKRADQHLGRRDAMKKLGRYGLAGMLGGSLGAGALNAQQAAAAPTARNGNASQEQRPNIVFILSDDLGYNHLGSYGQEKIKTPNLDRMAANGMKFTQSYAGHCLCAASRSSLLTGTHTGHTSVRGNSGGIPLLPEDVTFGEVLQDAGYTTGMFGKWGLGDARTTGVPSKQGFDEYFGTLDQVQAHFYYPEYLWENDEKYPLPGNEGDGRESYSNDLFTEKAMDFIRNQADADDPFMCYLPYTIPHTELLVPDDSLAEYLDDEGNSIFPETPFEYEGHYAGQEMPHAAFAAMVTRMDGYVGQIMDLLEEQGIADNTIVIFASDNGGSEDSAGVDLDFFRGNFPLRGVKGELYEGGIRVPSIAYWPGQIEEGVVSNHPWAFWDLLPTFADLASAESPSNIDGLSIVPALLGEEAEEHDYLYWENDLRQVTGPDGVTRPNPDGSLHQAVRMGDWKAVRHDPEEATELYYLPTDIAEKFNVADHHPRRVRRADQIMQNAHVEARAQNEPPSGHEDRLYR